MKKLMVTMCALGLIGAQTAFALDMLSDSSGLNMVQTSKMKTGVTAPAAHKAVVTEKMTAKMGTGAMTVRTRHLNIRTSAKMGSKIVKRLNKGDSVTVTGWSGKWAMVDGGFVWGAFLKK